MSNSPIIQINVKKTHLMAIAILLLIGAATSTVNIRDTTKMFDRLDMDGNPITNLQDPNNPQDAATKNYVDNNGGSGGGGSGLSMPKGSFSCAGPEGCGSNPVKTFDPVNGYLVSAQIEMAGTDGVGSFDSTSIRLNYVDGSSSTYKVSDDLYASSKKIHAYNTPNKKVDTIDVLVDAGSGEFYTSDHSVKWVLVSGGTGEDGQTGGDGGGGLDWSTARQVKDSYESDGDYSEASVTCNSNEVLVEASCHKNYDSDGTDVLCDTRTERKAEIVDGDSTGETVWGTCVDKN